MVEILLKKIAPGFCAVCLIAVFGYLLGRGAGSGMIESLVLKQNLFPLIISNPAAGYISVYSHLNSRDPLRRLSGYYALLDNHFIDLPFLRERYEKEKLIIIKETILWIMSFSSERNAVHAYYDTLFKKKGNRALKKKIIELKKKMRGERIHEAGHFRWDI